MKELLIVATIVVILWLLWANHLERKNLKTLLEFLEGFILYYENSTDEDYPLCNSLQSYSIEKQTISTAVQTRKLTLNLSEIIKSYRTIDGMYWFPRPTYKEAKLIRLDVLYKVKAKLELKLKTKW